MFTLFLPQLMKKIYAILFILIFSFQVLPLERVGKLLGSGTLNEEVQHSINVVKSLTVDDKVFRYDNYFVNISNDNIQTSSFLAFDEKIKQHPHIDVLLRPPNLY